jgi:hypothetical protein
MRNSSGLQSRNHTALIRTAIILVAGSLTLVIAAMPQSQTSKAQPPTKSQLDFFEGKIRPIFSQNCYKCHSGATGSTKGRTGTGLEGRMGKGRD